MNHLLSRVAFLTALAGPALSAAAQPLTLTVASGTATMSVTGTNPYSATIHVTAGSPCVFTLSTTAANTVLDSVEVECDADCLMTINENSGGTFAMVGDVLEALTSSPESFEIDRIFISGDLGSETPLEYRVAAEVVSRLEIGGDLTSEVTAGPRADNSDSDISLIEVGGTLVGDVYAQHGAIGTIAVGGDIGSTVQQSYIWAMHGIDSIDAGTVNAFLAATMTDPMAHINHIHFTGDFTGMIWTAAIEDSLTVPDPGATFDGSCTGDLWLGRLDVPVVINGDFITGELYTNGIQPGVTLDILGSTVGICYIVDWGGVGGLIRIAGDLGEDTNFWNVPPTITYDSSPGYVIINAANEGGEWLGQGFVAPDPNWVLLSPVPDYANEDLIGAVGEVPFRLHDGDCIPENGDTFAFNDGLVVLRFYGPVTWDEGFPFNITWCPGGSSCDPVSENARWMVVGGQGTRTIYLQYVDNTQTPAEIPSGRSYTIVPVLTGANKLLCDKLLTTSDVVVADFEYTFSTP